MPSPRSKARASAEREHSSNERVPDDASSLVSRAEALVSRLEKAFATEAPRTDWQASTAFRWRKKHGVASIDPVAHVHRIDLSDLQGIDHQKRLVEENTRQFVEGLPANNVLLTGARGTGKSSLIKALLNKYASCGLRLIEVEKQDHGSSLSNMWQTQRSRLSVAISPLRLQDAMAGLSRTGIAHVAEYELRQPNRRAVGRVGTAQKLRPSFKR